MKDKRTAYHSNRNSLEGSSIWAFTSGLLIGGGASHYISRPDYVCPHIVIKGKGTVKTSYGSTQVGVGDMFCLMSGIQVEYFEDPHDPWEFFWIHLTGSDDLSFAQACGFDLQCPWIRPPQPESIIECFQEIHNHLKDPQTLNPYHIVSLLYQIADLCCIPKPVIKKQKAYHQDLVDQAQLLINAQLHTGINITELSSMLNVNRTTLFHAFQNSLHVTPVQYLRNTRVARAKKLLAETNFNLDLIAKSSGFSNIKYFFKTFKEFEQTGPTNWRKQNKL